jgi:putative membrane protein
MFITAVIMQEEISKRKKEEGGKSLHPFYGPSSQLLQEGGFWWVGLVSMAMYLLFWAIVIIIAVRIFKKYLMNADYLKTKHDTAITILRERYAKGEIDTEEFKQMRSELVE